MPLTRTKLYILLVILCVAGYVWLGLNLSQHPQEVNVPGFCLLKHTTGIPCPSCGSTRSILSLLHGNIMQSLYWNPFGLLILMIMITLPVWIFYDLISGKDTLFKSWHKTEAMFKRPGIALSAIVLVFMNWIWNIYKGV
jgi:hypothetical protein